MSTDDQQFCLRWNNFQAYITSQFEALRDDEDFVDVTLACEGRSLGAHKVVLSACSPFFKELFKSNPCPHPIIFMRDVEVRHVVALLEFMYAGEVNVAQAQLAGFLRTAESLQIRGLTDASSRHQENDIFPDHPTSTSPSRRKLKSHSPSRGISSVSSTLTSEEPTPIKRLKPEEEPPQEELEDKLNPSINPFALQTKALHTEVDISAELIEPKIEPDYSEEGDEGNGYEEPAYGNLSGGMEIIPGTSGTPEISQESQQAWDNRKLHSLDPRPCPECGRVYSNLSNLRQHMRLIHNPTHVACPACRKGFKTALYLKRHLQACRARGGCHIPEGIGEGDITV